MLENLEEAERGELAKILPKGERRVLNWRHNLGQGASARVIDPKHARATPAWNIAHQATQALGLRFGSVDVVQIAGPTSTQPDWRILEVNSGVMMEFLARTLPQGPALARAIYTKALDHMFA
jgi:glutathione synthase/RimK-type ligase-like ATP-grasp enzyme